MIPVIIVVESTMRKEKSIILFLLIGICLSGMFIIKNPTVIRGQENEILHVIAPGDIPAVAVEVNESSEIISEKLAEVSTLFTQIQIPCIFRFCGMFLPSI